MTKFTGQVIRGSGYGRKLGFPTANLDTIPKIAQGIYTCQVVIEKKNLQGVLFFGARETLGKTKLSVEVHLLDFKDNLLGKKLTVTPLSFLRPPKKFANEKKLREAIAADCVEARKKLETC